MFSLQYFSIQYKNTSHNRRREQNFLGKAIKYKFYIHYKKKYYLKEETRDLSRYSDGATSRESEEPGWLISASAENDATVVVIVEEEVWFAPPPPGGSSGRLPARL